MQKYYITTTAPYVNSDPHIGFALEIIQADALARYHELKGEDVFFNTGTDEHGKKIYEKAVEDGKSPKEYVDVYAAKFRDLKNLLGLSDKLNFSRTTDDKHILAAQEMWRRVESAGYIRKGTYSAKYCVGCELEKQDSELIEGKCPLHPNKEIELINEENYFFCFSKLQAKLLEHYDRYQDFVIPAHRQKEIRNFVESGLTDFSISRLKEKMPWGVPVPGDESQVMYVWFDALTYYISALGWPSEEQLFENYWGKMDEPRAIQVAGKDNLRQQTSMWQAMLMAAGLPPSRQVVIHGFITSNGQKISKSLGNKVDPVEYVNKYGVDALRYYLLAKIDPFEDSDFTREKFEEVYRADLQNGLGNLVSRIASQAMRTGESYSDLFESYKLTDIFNQDIRNNIEKYEFNNAISAIWGKIAHFQYLISEEKAYNMELNKETRDLIYHYVEGLAEIVSALEIFMPTTTKTIKDIFSKPITNKIPPLFPRLA